MIFRGLGHFLMESFKGGIERDGIRGVVLKERR